MLHFLCIGMYKTHFQEKNDLKSVKDWHLVLIFKFEYELKAN